MGLEAKPKADTAAPAFGDLFEDEAAHRHEHSIEFQVTFLQYLLGTTREFQIVPVLVGSFQPFIEEGASPDDSPEVEAMVAALRAAAKKAGPVCYVSGADLAHVGRQFGDPWLLDQDRLDEQSQDDHKLLERACQGDAARFFDHVARQDDRRRICGLAPTYTMLELLGPARGELLKYDQAVADDRSECVSFASVAFFGTT